MNRLLVAIVLTAASAPAFAGPGSAAPAAAPAKAGPATTAVKTANDAIATLLKQKAPPAKVTASVRGFLDIDELGKRAMVDNWDKMTKVQQEEFLQTLRSLIEGNYVSALKANLTYDVVYSGEKVDGANTTVTTEVKAQRKGRPFKIEVDYVLVNQNGGYRCWDVITDGAGLVDNYRAMFNKIIEKDGVDGLLARMKKKLPSP